MQGNLVTLKGLLSGDKVFYIPLYQRGYAWEEKNLQDLWEDLYHLDPSKQHYFGTVLLKDSGTTETRFAVFDRFDVIDGQQRLTTILILLREIISQLNVVGDEEFREEEIPQLERDYLKRRNQYKLNPLDGDGEFFRDFVIDNRDFQGGDTQTRSQRRLVDAKRFFRERLEEVKKQSPDDFVDFLLGLKLKVDRLQIMEYVVNLDADAIRMFETVNDRGRPLNNIEKTKSFLMHTTYLGLEDGDGGVETALHSLNRHFSQIYKYFEDAVSAAPSLVWLRESDVQRYHFISYVSTRGDLGRYLDRLKDDIRNRHIQDPAGAVKYALAYAGDLEQFFFALKNILDTRKDRTELGIRLDKILKLGRLGNVFPLLIVSWLRFRDKPDHMAKILKLVEAFTVRAYVVVRYRSDTAQSGLYRMARRVHTGEWDADRLIGELRAINLDYVSAPDFRRYLSLGDFYIRLSSWSIRYLLSEYEIHLGKHSREPLDLAQGDILSSEYEVEHIWPISTTKLCLSKDEARQHEENVNRLGNLTIASKSWNSSMGDKPFGEKKLKYVGSSLRVQRDLADWTKWNADSIQEREDKIVEFALKRWSV